MAALCEGLGAAADRLVLGRSLSALHAAANSRVLGDERVFFAPHLAFSDAAFGRVLAEGRASSGDLRVVLQSGALAPIAALTGEEAGFVYLRGGLTGPAQGAPEPLLGRIAAAPTKVIELTEVELPGFSLPDGPFRVVDAWALPVGHWVQLLWANLLGLGPALWQGLGAGLGGAARVAWAALCAGSLEPYRLAPRVNAISRGARIHPRATVEGCIIGAGASVGAGAVVRGCILGVGARVEELALVEGSVLGENACVQRLAMVKFSLVEAGAFAAGIHQLAVLGARAAVKHGAVLMDQTLVQPGALGGALGGVRVLVGGELRRAPHGMLGVCVGPDAVIGSGVRVAAGRAIPAGLTIVIDPGAVVSRVDVPVGTRLARAVGGGLHPL